MSDLIDDLLGGLRLVAVGLEVREHFGLHLEYAGRGLLAGLDAGLVVRVDADELSVQTDRTLVERDEHADRGGVDALDGQRDRLSAVLVECLARPLQEPG